MKLSELTLIVAVQCEFSKVKGHNTRIDYYFVLLLGNIKIMI